MAGWATLRKMLQIELVQAREEGRDLASLGEDLAGRIEKADDAELAALHEALLATPIRPDFGYDEPTDLAAIRARRQSPVQPVPAPTRDALGDRMYGAWLGRCAGCALGKPVERYMHGAADGTLSRDAIRQYLEAISPEEYPLRDYFPAASPAADRLGQLWGSAFRGQIDGMPTDDDIRYTVIGQVILQKRGRDFTSQDVMETWIGALPYRMVCTAETQAYRNYVSRYQTHTERVAAEDIDWQWVATHQNPYREWIGAQIRADAWGYAAPGNPQLAAEYAWRDARISHVKNGVYGEMLCAAMIAAAFTGRDPHAIVAAGLGEIPATSRLHDEMMRVIAICDSHGCDWARREAVLDDIWSLLGHYDPTHTNNNAALVIAALLVGDLDFERTITLAVMGGWDTDCNGATAGSIVGARLGAAALPAKWTAPLKDQLHSAVIGYHPIAISECARRSVEIVHTMP